MPQRPLPPAPHPVRLLLVGADGRARATLRMTCAAELPRAEIEEVQAFADAVMRLARGGIDLVLLDLAHLKTLSAAAPLVLRGVAPECRVLGVGGATSPQVVGEWVAAEHLGEWLQRADRLSRR